MTKPTLIDQTLRTLNQKLQLENIRLKNEINRLKQAPPKIVHVDKSKLSTGTKKSS